MSGTVRAVFKWFADSFILNGEAWNGRSTATQWEVFCDHCRKQPTMASFFSALKSYEEPEQNAAFGFNFIFQGWTSAVVRNLILRRQCRTVIYDLRDNSREC